jgi:hypothetical protein
MQRHILEHYEFIPIPPVSHFDYEPRPCRGRYHRPDVPDGMLQPTDNIHMLYMMLKGIPQTMAAE